MAKLHIISPNGTDYSINLDTMNCQRGDGSSGGGAGWCRLPNGFTIQWWSHIDTTTQMGGSGDITFGPVYYPIQFTSGAWSLMITSWTDTPFILMHNDRGWNSGSGVGQFRAVAPPNCSGDFCFDVFVIGSIA